MRLLQDTFGMLSSGVPGRFRGLLAASLLGVASVSAGAPAFATEMLYLEFGSLDRVRLNEVSAETGAPPYRVQPLKGGSSKQTCELKFDSSVANYAELFAFSGSTRGAAAKIGFNSGKDLLGLRDGSGGVPCGRVGAPGDFIQLSLGSYFNGSNLQVLATTLTFDIRSSARILITPAGPYYGSGSAPTYEIVSGAYQVAGLPFGGEIQPNGQVNCANTGPCTVTLAGAIWTSLKLQTSNLQAGSAGEWSIGTGPSTFELGEVKTIACEPGVNLAESDGDPTYFRRLFDAVGTDCTPLPYSVTFQRVADDREFEFLANYDVLGTTDVDGEKVPVEPAFAWEVTWDPEILVLPEDRRTLATSGDQQTLAELVPFTRQQFIKSPVGGYVADPVYLVDFCAGEPILDETPELQGASLKDRLLGLELLGEPVNGIYPNYDMSAFPGTQYGCFLTRRVDILPAAMCVDPEPSPLETTVDPEAPDTLCVQVTETGYVRGDWTATRTLR